MSKEGADLRDVLAGQIAAAIAVKTPIADISFEKKFIAHARFELADALMEARIKTPE